MLNLRLITAIAQDCCYAFVLILMLSVSGNPLVRIAITLRRGWDSNPRNPFEPC